MSSYTMLQIRRILSIAIPSGMQGALDVILMTFSVLFASSLSSDNVGALGIGVSYLILFYPVSSLFYVGTNLLVSRSWGAKDYGTIGHIFSSMFFASFLFSIPTMAIGYFCIDYYASFMSLSNALWNLFSSYVSICIIGFPVSMARNVIIASFAGIGDTKRPFVIRLFVVAVSVVLNYCLILGHFGFPQFGIQGAAITSVVVGYAELVFLLCFSPSRKFIVLRLSFVYGFIRKGLSMGIPTSLERSFTIFSGSVVLKFVSNYTHLFGDSAIIGYQAGMRVEALSFVPGFGFTVAIMSLVGQSIGAGNYRRMMSYIRTTILIAVVLFSIVGILLVMFSSLLSGAIIKNDDVALQISTWYLLAVGLSQAPQMISFIYDGALRGAGKVKIPCYVNILSIVCFRYIPMSACTYLQAHLYCIFLIIFLETYIRSVIFHIVTRRVLSRIY